LLFGGFPPRSGNLFRDFRARVRASPKIKPIFCHPSSLHLLSPLLYLSPDKLACARDRLDLE
jgi:hypothetical protein